MWREMTTLCTAQLLCHDCGPEQMSGIEDTKRKVGDLLQIGKLDRESVL